MRTVGFVVIALTSVTGCGLVLDLGPPVDGAAPPDVLSDAGPQPDGGQPDAPAPSEPVYAQSVAVGASHACAMVIGNAGSTLNNTVRCWGANTQGQLGVDPATTSASVEPVPVGHTDGVKFSSVALGASASCAVTTDDFLFCWGDVPDSMTTSGVQRYEPTPPNPAFWPAQMDFRLTPLSGVSSVAIGASSGCTVYDQGLVCWGLAAVNQGTDAGVVPLDGGVFIADQLEAVSVGGRHACARSLRNGGLFDAACWGANDFGQAGFVASSGVIRYPADLGLFSVGTGVLTVVTGGDSSCALFNDHSLACWGRNDLGQLGSPGPSTSNPVTVPLPQGLTVTQITMGDAHACARLSDDNVWCWGDNSRGQLGNGSVGGTSGPTPVMRLVPGDGGMVPFQMKAVDQVAAGGGTTCVIVPGDAHPWCWGANDQGQAGTATGGASVVYATPVPW